jgi:hypothetical protein
MIEIVLNRSLLFFCIASFFGLRDSLFSEIDGFEFRVFVGGSELKRHFVGKLGSFVKRQNERIPP